MNKSATMTMLVAGLAAVANSSSAQVLPSEIRPKAPHVRLPIPSESDIPLAQIGDYRITDKSTLAGRRSIVWGASQPDLGPGVYTTFYYPLTRDADRARDIDWYKKNKPDWVMYKCDKVSPAYLFTYSWGAYTPLDITNPEVRNYILETFILPAVQKGYPAIGFDNVAVNNVGERCGVWRGGAWFAKFGPEHWNRPYAEAITEVVRWFRKELHARGAALALNFGFDPLHVAESERVLDLADIWVDERGFITGCGKEVVDQNWRIRAKAIARFVRRGTFVSINQVCNDLANAAPEEIEWVVANFLLLRGPRSHLAISGFQEYGRLHDIKPLAASVGRPIGDFTETAGLFTRAYERAIVAVNPSSLASLVFNLPRGAFATRDGRRVSGAVTMPAKSGQVFYSAN